MRIVVLVLALVVTSTIAFAQQTNNKKNRKQAEATATGHLKLYPTVADKYVNIYVEYTQPTDFVLTILATPLSNEKKWQEKAKSSYQHKLDVTQLLNGEYTIVLEGGGVRELGTFTVKR